MMHALVLDDLPEECDATREVLRRVFPGAVIETAETVEEARCLLDRYTFDFIIADVKVPVAAGHKPEASSEWAALLESQDSRITTIIITSAYLAEEEVRELTSDVDIAAPPVAKGSKSTERIVARIAGHIIRRGMNEAFGAGGAGEVSRSSSISWQSGTAGLARLIDAIQTLWYDLSPRDQERVKERFDVSDSPQGVSVQLGGGA